MTTRNLELVDRPPGSPSGNEGERGPGARQRRSASDHVDVSKVLAGGGEMGKLIAAKDWSKTPLGPIESWSPELRTTVSIALASTFPINIAWGPGNVQIYNDGYWPICAGKHPGSMGQNFRECWAPAFPVIGPAYERAWAGEASYLENQRMFVDRKGYLEETFSPFPSARSAMNRDGRPAS